MYPVLSVFAVALVGGQRSKVMSERHSSYHRNTQRLPGLSLPVSGKPHERDGGRDLETQGVGCRVWWLDDNVAPQAFSLNRKHNTEITSDF